MTDNPTANTKEEADRFNLRILTNAGLSHTDALLVLDMVNHFEQQLDELFVRTIQAMPSGAAVPIAATLMGLVTQRKGGMVQSTVIEHFGVGRKL